MLMSLWTLLGCVPKFLFVSFLRPRCQLVALCLFWLESCPYLSSNLSGLAIEVLVTDVCFCYSFDTATLGVPVPNSLRHYNRDQI